MLVHPYGSAEILLPVSSRPILLQLSLWDGICASCTGLSSICFTWLTLTCTHAGTLRLGVWIRTSPGWPAGCNFLSGLETEIKRLSVIFIEKRKQNLSCTTWTVTLLYAQYSKELVCNMYLNVLNWEDCLSGFDTFYCFIRNAINIWPKTAS